MACAKMATDVLDVFDEIRGVNRDEVWCGPFGVTSVGDFMNGRCVRFRRCALWGRIVGER